ncbi:MAG: hypothetical protein ACYTG1_08435 [Planctomycetota bacterium]|jgi:hypothetical protein
MDGRPDADAWRVLRRFDDPVEAQAVATSIAAMEFEVRLAGRGRPVRGDDGPQPPYVVEVRPEDWPDLEILHEQSAFDERVRARAGGGARWRHRLLLAVIVVVAVLGVLRLIEL